MPIAIAYIDGFNLFNGIEDTGLLHHNWLHLQKLAQSLLSPLGFEVPLIKYSTSRVPDHEPFHSIKSTGLKLLNCSQR